MLPLNLIKNYWQYVVIISLFASTVFFYQQNKICKAEKKQVQSVLQIQNEKIKEEIKEAKSEQEKVDRAVKDANNIKTSSADDVMNINRAVVPNKCEDAMGWIRIQSSKL